MGNFGWPRFWAKNEGGDFQNDEKLKKKLQKVSER